MKPQFSIFISICIIGPHALPATTLSFDFNQTIESMDIRTFDPMRKRLESEPVAFSGFEFSAAQSASPPNATGSHKDCYIFSMPLVEPNRTLNFKGIILTQKPGIDYKILMKEIDLQPKKIN